jgi:hypothetical protein
MIKPYDLNRELLVNVIKLKDLNIMYTIVDKLIYANFMITV